jgi:hypothetical protein
VLLSEPDMARLIDGRHSERDLCTETALRDRYERLYDAFLALSARQRVVLVELLKRGDQSYLDLSGRLGLPVGCIGPIRQRAVTRLRLDPGTADLSAQYPEIISRPGARDFMRCRHRTCFPVHRIAASCRSRKGVVSVVRNRIWPTPRPKLNIAGKWRSAVAQQQC